jgi:predicted nuclease of predicted toxin-antitoxin system
LKLLLDQNISHKLVPVVEPRFPGSQHVGLLGLDSADDEKIWRYAAANEFVIVTRDSDYFEMSMERGAPPFVLWLDLKNPSTDRMRQTLLAAAPQLPELFLRQRQSCVHVKGVGVRKT